MVKPTKKKKGKALKILLSLVMVSVIAVVLLVTIRIPVAPIRVALVYYAEPAEHTAQYFEQPLVYHMAFSRVNAESTFDLGDFDLVVADASILDAAHAGAMIDALQVYTENGGRLALTSRARDILTDLAPAVAFVAYSPGQSVSFDEDAGFGRIGQIFTDYATYFGRFYHADELRDRQAGYALALSEYITPIVYAGGRDSALAALIALGDGEIYYFGALLPDPFFATGFDFMPRDGEKIYFNPAAAAADHLLWNELAAVVSQDINGFSLHRVFGSHGRPAMAHQNHSEILSNLGYGTMEAWAEMAQAHGQIASFSLVYGFYDWFLRYESFGYALANGDGSFQNDRTTDFYAWGTPIVYNDRWLNLARYEGEYSFFLDPTDPIRPYPSVIDFNGDGVPDLISGSSDGLFHVFAGATLHPRWTVERVGLLTGQSGEPLSVPAFSAPAFYGTVEAGGFLVSGSYSGNLYIWTWYGGLEFADVPTVLSPPAGETLSAPDVVDFNGDGAADIIVGFASGHVYLLDGANDFHPRRILETGEMFAAPRAVDLSGDGSFDLVVGTNNGDILQYLNRGGVFEYVGSLQERANAGAINFKGTAGINSANNITPLFVDLTGDGLLDLVFGQLEYGGFSVALSDELFPYRGELLATIETLHSMFVPILLHNYVHHYKSLEDEIATIRAEVAALRAFGLEAPTGVNQHTWTTSGQSHGQTQRLQVEEGFLWNFGFRPSNSPANPSSRAEYGMITPFYLHGENGNQMLIYNANYLHDYIPFEVSARYGLPVTIYRTTWNNVFSNPASVEAHLVEIRGVMDHHLYNFVTEPQLASSIAAAMHTEVRVYVRLRDMIADFFRELTGRAPRFDRYLAVEHRDMELPLFDAVYADSIGVRVALGDGTRSYLDTDAPVVLYRGGGTYLSLAGNGQRGTRIWTRHDAERRDTHLLAVNLPADIRDESGEITVSFLEDGLQQVFVYSASGFDIQGDGFEVSAVRDHVYRISMTGARSTLVIVTG